jgi:hypothetical protein
LCINVGNREENMSKILAVTLMASAVVLTLADLRSPTGDQRSGVSAGSTQIAQADRCPKGKRYDYQSDSCK